MWILNKKLLSVKDLIKRQVHIEDEKAHVNEPDPKLPDLRKSIAHLLKINKPNQSPFWRRSLGKLLP